MASKTCTRCGEQLPLTDFGKQARGRGGLQSQCKTCRKKVCAAYRAANPEKVSEARLRWKTANPEQDSEAKRAWQEANRDAHRRLCREWQAKNRDRANATSRAWQAENRERHREANRSWKKANKDAVAASTRKRQAAQMRRTIALAPHHQDEIKHLYALAKQMSDETGVKHHVDHIVPLQGKEVSGLHVPWNLRVVPAAENISKGNKVDPALAMPAFIDQFRKSKECRSA